MIFKSNIGLDISQEIIALGIYHPYWHTTALGRRVRNWNFDSYSEALLNLKYREEESHQANPTKLDDKLKAIEYFRQRLDSILDSGFSIAVVPPHKAYSKPSGICSLARLLVKNGRVDATRCLVRCLGIAPLHSGGQRNWTTHLNSIDVCFDELFLDKEVLLLDDIATTKRSILTCKDKLMQRGASVVECLVLGKVGKA